MQKPLQCPPISIARPSRISRRSSTIATLDGLLSSFPTASISLRFVFHCMFHETSLVRTRLSAKRRLITTQLCEFLSPVAGIQENYTFMLSRFLRFEGKEVTDWGLQNYGSSAVV